MVNVCYASENNGTRLKDYARAHTKGPRQSKRLQQEECIVTTDSVKDKSKANYIPYNDDELENAQRHDSGY